VFWLKNSRKRTLLASDCLTETFERMLDIGTPPNLITCTALITVCKAAGDWGQGSAVASTTCFAFFTPVGTEAAILGSSKV